jgi:hypothetical protein
MAPPGEAVRSIVAMLDGTAVVARRAVTPAGARRVALELARLRAAAHPGVIEVVAASPPPRAGYATRWVGGSTLATAALPPAEAVATVAEVTVVLADLHARGIVHGRLTADRICLGDGGRPILAALGDGSLADGAPARPADDVAQVGELLASVARDGPSTELFPATRFGLTTRSRGDDVVRAALLLADQACQPDPDRRPTMAQLASSLATLAAGERASGRRGRLRGAGSTRASTGRTAPADQLRPAAAGLVRWLAAPHLDLALAGVLATTAALAHLWCWQWIASRDGAAALPWFASQPATIVAAAALQATLGVASTALLVGVSWRWRRGTGPTEVP